MPRALLSVSDKTGIVEFARGLAARGFELVSTGGTAKALADAGLAVTNVSDVTGFPEMMDGRVKTLHPKIHGGILARRDHPDDLAAAASHGIGLVDLVAVNLYPFADTAKRPGVTFDELIEQVDIGGPSMVRAAAKNFRDVLVIVDPKRYSELLSQLDHSGGPTLAFRFGLAQAAIAHTGEYDTAMAATLATITVDGQQFVRGPAPGTGVTAALPDRVDLSLEKIRDLRYGENPHQRAALYATTGAPGLARAQQLHGKEMSYNNYVDADAAWRAASDHDGACVAIIKHANPCGIAVSSAGDVADAHRRAHACDPVSAFGGVIAVNRARVITQTTDRLAPV